MSLKKIIVPEGMRFAAGKASDGFDPWCYLLYRPLEAALLWLSENPIVPTDEQVHSLAFEHEFPNHKWMLTEWQRRMFLAPDPEEAKTEKKRTLKEIEIERAEVELAISKARLEEFRLSNEKLAKTLAGN